MIDTHATPLSAQFSEAKRKLLENTLAKISLRPPDSWVISRRPADREIPLAVAQEQVWQRAQKLRRRPALYNECITIHRNGPLDIPTLERSLAEVLRRHEIWRTCFGVKEGKPVQIIQPALQSLGLPVVDLRGLPKEKREMEASRLAFEHSRAPFDMQQGPLVRFLLLQLEDQEFRLHLTMHQSVVDGVSVYRVFPKELTTLYEAFSVNKPSPLSDLPIQYADYSCWQRGWLRGETLGQQLAYWQKQLGGDLPVLNWPNDRPRPATESYRGEILPFAWSARLSEVLQELGQREGVTLFSILLAGFTALLHQYTGQDDIIVGTLSPSGRKRSEVQGLIGYFLNPVALRVRPSGSLRFRDLLLQARTVVSEALSNDDVPLEWLAEELRVKSDATRHPFFQLAISLGPEVVELPAGWGQTFMDVGGGGARWDLYLEFSSRTSGMIGRAQFNPDLFERTTVEGALGDLEALLEAASANPLLRLSELTVRKASQTCTTSAGAGRP